MGRSFRNIDNETIYQSVRESQRVAISKAFFLLVCLRAEQVYKKKVRYLPVVDCKKPEVPSHYTGRGCFCTDLTMGETNSAAEISTRTATAAAATRFDLESRRD